MKTAIILNSDIMGNGNDSLGTVLMGAFLKKLWIRSTKPDVIVLYNSGVRLLTKEAGVLEAIVGLEEAGVEILACGTCLDDYGIRDAITVGRISNMEEIVNVMMTYEKVITV